MKGFTKGALILIIVGSLAGCSRKNNTFINRNWHALTAKYNTLYNGALALDLGKEEMYQNYQDNYWNILPIERLSPRKSTNIPENSGNPNFAVAEDKAIKAIQRHSMLIANRERNPQIDEAYLLLGKARYYDQRFLPALEAFNYILHKYPLSNTINEAKVWREKTNIQLGFNDLAIENLRQILDGEGLKEDVYANAAAALAHAYMDVPVKDSAVKYLERAAELTDNESLKGRYWFVAGQIYDALGKPDLADHAYEEVVALKRKIPRMYRIQAQIARLRSSNDPGETELKLNKLLDLAEDRENRPYLDYIFFELAEFHYNRNKPELAIEYYNKSLESPSSDAFLKALALETLGNIHFEAAEFEAAGAYYDSTLQHLNEQTREYRLISKKRENLDEVIYYENLARSTDSILKLAGLSEAEQLEHFKAYTATLKERLEHQLEQEDISGGYFNGKRSSLPGMPTAPGGGFYFYNPTTVAYGKEEFFELWGRRAPVDGWRTGGQVTSKAESERDDSLVMLENDPRFDPKTYVSRIPDDPAVLDSIRSDRNYAYYQLGLMYYEKFEEYERAAERLESLLMKSPEKRLLLPAQYHLYKIHKILGNDARAESLRNGIVLKFPDSRYAAILQNPESLQKEKNDPRKQYTALYELYEQQQFVEVIEQIELLIQKYTGDEIVPKFELLKALAEGRLYGLDRYQESLRFVALNYPQSAEGKKARDLLEKSVSALPEKEFIPDTAAESFKLVFPLIKEQTAKADTIRERISNALDDLGYQKLRISVDVYDPSRNLLVVHGFSSVSRAMGFGELLSSNENYQIDQKYFYISTPNYRIVQIHKNLNEYLNQLKTPPTHVRTGKKE